MNWLLAGGVLCIFVALFLFAWLLLDYIERHDND